MRLPIKRKQPAQVLSLSDLSGGLNMRDGISEVLDNQLTNCKNMWWQDGVLRTRAGIVENQQNLTLSETIKTPKFRRHDCYKYTDDTKVQLCSVKSPSKINFFWDFGNKIESAGLILTSPSSYFVCQKSNTIYCFTSEKEIYKIADVTDVDNVWELVSEDEIEAPLIATSCNYIGTSALTANKVISSGVMVDGYNLIGDYCRVVFNAYNPDKDQMDDDGNSLGHYMVYGLLRNYAKQKYKGKKLTVNYTHTNGEVYTHVVILSGNTISIESSGQGDGYRIAIYKNRLYFLEEKVAKEIEELIKNNNITGAISKLISAIVKVNDENSGKNNIDIKMPVLSDDKSKSKVFNMSECEWFGGAAGLMGGTRLFLCGNSKSNNSDLVVWSGLDNPLYFPENAYFYVGNETGAVTGFGKQADKLVIFKENETWFTEYRQNTNITAEDLINQNVIDYASSSVYFPLTQINASIGCPYPDTVELCRNRLVWLGNNNSVNTLVDDSQYSERSIFSVSEMVKREIKSIGADDTASACDWNGYYCLKLGNKLLLMDYNCYGYSHVASYSKTEDANIRIPWYLWDIPKGKNLAVIGDKLCALSMNGNKIESYCFDKTKTKDTVSGAESEIVSSFTTKIFDFGLPHIRKNIEQINLQLGNNGGEAIDLYFITENGTEETQVFTDGTETENYTAGFISSRAVFPCIKQVLRFGLKFESKGALAVDSVILKYRTLGGTR